ncbi:MAG: TonB-dependent receptor [Acidobacteria bacterium]|nr:TonB-dependent receptor [Acidobacteriota bacterium]
MTRKSGVCVVSTFGWTLRGLVLSVILFSASLAMAQLTRGTISGSVTDQSGAAVPGAAITITNVDTGVTRTTETGATGRYEAPNLPVGNYEVRATLGGFQTSIRAGITLSVGRTAVVDHVLQVGEVAQAVTVTGEAGLVETTTATVSNLVSEEQVVDLPLNNRDLVALTYLQPGVLKVPQGARQGVFSGMGNKLSVAGARQTHNLYLTDGVSSGDLSGNIAGASGGSTGVETIKEFQVITNNYSAEYTSAAGAIVSMITKSGTNAFHGSAFEFLRNDNLDAANFFDNSLGNAKPEFVRNQFGGSAGGPILRDKTFFFASYEGLRERRPTTGEIRMPSADALRGILPGEDPITIDPAVVPYLALYPIPGQGNTLVNDFGDGTVRLSGPTSENTREDYASGKLDHQFANEKLGFVSGTWNYMRSSRVRSGIIADISGDSEDSGSEALESERDSVSASLTSIVSPTALNVLKFGWARTRPAGELPISGEDTANLAFTNKPSIVRMGQLNAGGEVDSIGWRVNGSVYLQNNIAVADDFSLTRGDHSLKFGGVFSRMLSDQVTESSGVNGIWDFREFDAFLLNRPKRLTIWLPPELVRLEDFLGDTSSFSGEIGLRKNHNLTQKSMGVYIQDNWRVRPSLTLNLGFRYSYSTIPKEVNGATSSLRNIAEDTNTTIGPLYGNNPTTRSFSPRFGFAWAPGNQKTSVRGGFGVFYIHPRLYHIRTSLQVSPPFVLSARVDGDSSGNFRRPRISPTTKMDFPNLFFTQGDILAQRTRPDIRPIEFNQKLTYLTRWSLNLQREVGSSWLLSAGYTGSRGVHLWTQQRAEITQWVIKDSKDANAPTVGVFPDNPKPGQFKFFSEDADIVNPNFGVFRPQSPSASSFYHGVALSASQRLTRGLQWQVAYTLSKAIDMASGVTSNGDNLPQGQRGIYYFDNHLKRSLSSADIRNNLVSNFTWTLPEGDLSGIGGALLGGWQINGILTLTDGHPLSVLDEESSEQDDAIGETDLLMANLIPGGNNNPVLGSPNQWFDVNQFIPSACVGATLCKKGDPDFQPGFFGNTGRNTLTSPGLATFDLSLFKNINVTENTRFQFRAEFFNIFNRANFGVPIIDEMFLEDGTPNEQAGEIRETATDSRQIQFGLKFIF